MKNISGKFMAKNILAILCIAVVAGAPLQLEAQAPSARPAAAPVPLRATKALSTPGKAPQKHPLVWHPNAAQRELRPSDLVAVTTPSGEKRYVRKKSPKPAK